MASTLGDLSTDIFIDMKGRIETGLANGFSVQSRLIMLGQISYAAGRGDITINQGRELEELLGLKELVENFDRVREMGFWGDLESAA